MSAKCILCKASENTVINYYGNTSGMIRHLKVHKMFKPSDEEEDDEEMKTPESYEHQYENKQKKRFEKIHKALLIFVLSSALAFNIVANPLFNAFIKLLDSSYTLPSPYVLSNTLLDREYIEVVRQLKLELPKVNALSITLDPWTSCQTLPYLGM